MFSTIAIRTAYSRHVLRAHLQGFKALSFIDFIRVAANAASF